jgi:sphingolipid 4-desaturase/C4-monooxygenase
MEHHRYLGLDGIDTDIPTLLEVKLLSSFLGKLFFLTFQIFFYALRPGLVHSIPFTKWTFGSIIFQALFDMTILKFYGWKPILYLLFSSFFAGSLHPMSAHFIAEHYLFSEFSQETWSYYGPLNLLAYNVGYHNEHHDFPSVPWTKLPELRQIAKEYYDILPEHKSWVGVIWEFLSNDQVSLWARVKREKGLGGERAKSMKERVEQVQNDWKGSEEMWEKE